MPLTWRGGLLLSQFPHRVRLWRRVEQRTHDRGVNTPTWRDVYSDNIPVRLRPAMLGLDSALDGVPNATAMTCDMPARDSTGRRLRVQPSDILEIKWTRRFGAERKIVETTLTSNAAAGTTALNVANSWGFEPEDIIVLETAAENGWFVGMVDSVSADVVTLRSTKAVTSTQTFSSGDTVKVAWWAEVTGRRNPLAADVMNVLSISQAPSGDWFRRT